MRYREPPRQRNLRKGRFTQSGRAYAITKCVEKGISLTDGSRHALIVINALFWMDSHARIHLGAFVVMPDHYHLILVPKGSYTLSEIMKSIGRFTAGRINRTSSAQVQLAALHPSDGSGRRVWQTGYYDRAVKETEALPALVDYIHNNPVRKKLISNAALWSYSSLNPSYANRIRWNLFA